MKRVIHIQRLVVFAVVSLAVLFSACSNEDYLNAIPANSIVVASVDIVKMSGQNKGDTQSANLIKDLLQIDDVSDCGLDITSKLYLFESIEGNLGLVAKVSDKGSLETWLQKLSKKGHCSSVFKRGNCHFCTIKGSWVAGFNSTVAVVMGPVITSQVPAVQQQILKYTEQDENDGLKCSPLFDRLDSIDAPISIVAQVAALPDKLSAPFSFGAPKEADASQIIVAAGVNFSTNGYIDISGETFSLNKDINKALQTSLKTFRPITRKRLGGMSTNDALGVFLNVDGKRFIELLHSNRSFQLLLTGINTAIDMDNIIRSIDGDIAIVMPRYEESGVSLRMGANLVDKKFLADVAYWKQSCPKDGHIEDMGKDSYCYKDKTMSYYFGVTDDLQYYSGCTPELAILSISTADNPLPQSIVNSIVGKRFCMVFNMDAMLNSDSETKALFSVLKSVLGNVNTIVYSIK